MNSDYKLNNDIYVLPGEKADREKALRECNDHEQLDDQRRKSELGYTSGTADFNFSGTNFVLDNMIQEGELVLLYGEPKVGKTYIAMHMALCMALRIPWLGIKTMPDVDGSILWIDHDMGHKKSVFRMQSVREGLKMQYGLDNKAFGRFLLLDKSNFSDSGLPSLDFAAETSVEELKNFILDHQIKVCFIDHLTKIRGCTDENSSTDMTRVFNNIQTLKNDTGCAFIILHHSGKSEKAGARGSVVVYAEPDNVFALVKNDKADEGSIRLDIGCARDMGKSQIVMSMGFVPMCSSDGKIVRDQKGREISIFQLQAGKTASEEKVKTKKEDPLVNIILEELRQKDGISTNKFAQNLCEKYPDVVGSVSTVKRNVRVMLKSNPPLLIAKAGKRNAQILYLAKENHEGGTGTKND